MTGRRPAATLAVLSLAQFLIALDYSIIYIALPSIAADLHLAPTFAQWVVSAYAVLFAGFLIAGGRLADRFGAARLFVAAIVMFGVASAIGAGAADGAVLLAARAAQGVGAAMLQPAVLGLIGTTFPAGPARSRALTVWGSVGACGLAVGAILGGVLTSASWRLTFLINVPLTLLCALGAVAWIRAPRRPGPPGRAPILASLLGTGAVLAVALALTLSSARGATATPTLCCLALAIVLLVEFVRNENVSRNVLIPPVLRRIGSLRIGALASALYMASVGSEFYLLTLLLQSVKQYSPLRAGIAFLPLAVLVTAGSTAAGRAVRRFSAAGVLITGFALAASGLAWLAFALHGNSYAVDLLPGLLLSGFGHGIIYTAMFIIGTYDVPPAHQGTAGALMTTSQYLSGALTVAGLTLALGPSPDARDLRIAVLITATAAASGVVLVAARRRRFTIGAGTDRDRTADLGEAMPRRDGRVGAAPD
jgi:MFS family permease